MNESFFLVDLAGQPKGTVDLDGLDRDGLLLMYELTAAAGDERSIDAILADWAKKVDGDSMRHIALVALEQLAKNVLDVLLGAYPEPGARAIFAAERDRRKGLDPE